LRTTERVWLFALVRVAVVLLTLAACEHAGPTPKRKPDPIKLVHDEFELLPASAAAGTSPLCSRTFTPDDKPLVIYDGADLVGRLRTLFGPRDGDTYPLRYKKTGVIITALSNEVIGPYYGATPEPGEDARHAADPVLKTDHPPPGVSDAVYHRHACAAAVGPKNAAAIARFDALVAQVPLADYSETQYSDGNLWRIGAKGGESFRTAVPAAEGMAFVLARTRPDAYEPDVAVIEYYLTHAGQLPGDAKPKALAALAHVEALAKQIDDPEERDDVLDDVKDFRDALR
jgi:hypothetical protein